MAISIRTRLTLIYTGVAVALILAFNVLLYFAIFISFGNAADTQLRNQVDRAATFLSERSAAGTLDTLPDEIGKLGSLFQRDDSLLIQDGSGKTFCRTGLFRQETRETPSAPAAKPLHRPAVRTYSRTIVLAGRTISIEAALDRNYYYHHAFRRLRTLLFSEAPLAALIASLLGYWFSGQALRRFDLITQTVRDVDTRKLSERLTLDGTGDELDRLSQTLNNMLDRLQVSFERTVRFTADASHELRTPLALIQSTTELLRMGTTDQHSMEDGLDSILWETKRMSSLVADLLYLSRTEAHQHTLRFELLNPLDLVKHPLSQGKKLAQERGVALTFSSSQSIFPVRGSALAIERLILILIDNAVAHTPNGGEVKLTLLSMPKELRIEVKDSGCGIAPEHHKRIFDRFYRIDPARRRSEGGAGLGLALAKSVADAHLGTISVVSQEGQGATFTAVLPMQPFRDAADSST